MPPGTPFSPSHAQSRPAYARTWPRALRLHRAGLLAGNLLTRSLLAGSLVLTACAPPAAPSPTRSEIVVPTATAVPVAAQPTATSLPTPRPTERAPTSQPAPKPAA